MRPALDRHLRSLDAQGIDLQRLSPRPVAMLHWERPFLVEAWTCATNDLIARQCKLHPDRFQGVAQLPQTREGDLRVCVHELERCVTELKFVAAIVNPDPGADRQSPGLNAPYWYPLYERAQDLNATLIVHPSMTRDTRLDGVPHAYQYNNLTEESLATLLLEKSDVFERFPKLRIVVCHCGGAPRRMLEYGTPLDCTNPSRGPDNMIGKSGEVAGGQVGNAPLMIVCLSPNGPMHHRIPGVPMRLLVATTDGVAILDHDTRKKTWLRAGHGLKGQHISALMFEPDGGVFAATHGHGIYASTDLGNTWTPASQGLTVSNVFSLSYTGGTGPVSLLAGTEPVHLFRSRDHGRTWEEERAVTAVPGQDKWFFPAPPHVAHLKSIAPHPHDPDTLYACIEQGALLKTVDGARSWRELSTYARDEDRWYHDIHKIVPVPSDPDRLFMSTGVGVYASRDAGEHWQRITPLDFAIGYPDHLIVSPFDADTVFVSGAATSPDLWRETKVARATVMGSRDGGRSWSPASRGLPQNDRSAIEAMSIAVQPQSYTLFLGNTDGEVYSCDGEGGEWRPIAKGLAPVSKAMHASHLA